MVRLAVLLCLAAVACKPSDNERLEGTWVRANTEVFDDQFTMVINGKRGSMEKRFHRRITGELVVRNHRVSLRKDGQVVAQAAYRWDGETLYAWPGAVVFEINDPETFVVRFDSGYGLGYDKSRLGEDKCWWFQPQSRVGDKIACRFYQRNGETLFEWSPGPGAAVPSKTTWNLSNKRLYSSELFWDAAQMKKAIVKRPQLDDLLW